MGFSWEGYHDVVILPSKQAFDECDFSNVKSLGFNSPVTYTVTDTTYFACTVGTHCVSGQILAATIGDVTSTPVGTDVQPMTDTLEARVKEPEVDIEVSEEKDKSGATIARAKRLMS